MSLRECMSTFNIDWMVYHKSETIKLFYGGVMYSGYFVLEDQLFGGANVENLLYN